jgi:putative transposase
MKPSPEATLADRALAHWVSQRRVPAGAAHQLLAAAEALTLACLTSLERLRERGRLGRLDADNKRLRLENAELRELIAIHRSRLEPIPPRQRPHYSPETRFRILQYMRTYLLSVEETARRCLLSGQTLYNWLRELAQSPSATTIGQLLRPQPPLRRYHDLQRRLVRQMKEAGFGGHRLIADHIGRFGWTPSPRSVGRFCKERDHPPTSPSPAPTEQVLRSSTVQGRYPNHVWMADITCIPTVFPFLHFHVTVVFDVFSRLPLRAAVSLLQPSAPAVLELLRAAVQEHGRPRHFVSDRGSQFTAPLFSSALHDLGIKQRLGALYKHGSIALIERFFKTLKSDLGIPHWKPWSRGELQEKLHLALLRYSYHRPHSALGGRVTIEAYFGIADQQPRGNLAPRGPAGAADLECPFQILFLDPDRTTLPILAPAA